MRPTLEPRTAAAVMLPALLSLLLSYSAPVAAVSIRRLAEDGCPLHGLPELVKEINTECCRKPDGTPLDCKNGPPPTCTAICASFFVPFWRNCHTRNVYTNEMKPKFNAFSQNCKATNFNDNGKGNIGKSVMNPKLCHVQRSDKKERTFKWLEISPLKMDACVGKTPAESSKCGSPPPRKFITAKDIGRLIKDSDWTTNGQTNWAGDDGWFDVKLPWSFPWYGKAEDTITVGTNGILTFGTPQYIYGGSEPVPCHGAARCKDHQARGIGVDGVIAIMWTDLNPTDVTADPHHQCGPGGCHGGGAVYYKVELDHFIVEYAKVQSWSWNNQYNIKDPGQTFEAVLYRTGDVMMQYLDTYCERCSTAWSTVSIGFESQDGNRGQQIEYGDIPADSTQFFIPAECHTYDANIHH